MTTATIPEIAALAKFHVRLAALERRLTELERASTAIPQPVHRAQASIRPLADRMRQAHHVLEAVAGYCAIPVGEITGRRRDPTTVLARHVAAYLLVADCGLSSVVAGRLLHRDHSTVLYGIARVRQQASLEGDIAIIRRRCKVVAA